jgi:DNA polymerase-4
MAQVLSPHSHFMPAAKTRYSQVSSEVIDVLLDFSPLIEPQEWWHFPGGKTQQPAAALAHPLPAHFCLDLEGLPRQEALPFVQEIGRAVRRETHLAPAVGLAEHKFTAQVAATVCRPERALPVKEGEEAQFLAARPLSFLPLDKKTAHQLYLLGVHTLGQLTDLPLAALREQFGPAIAPFYRLAQGADAEGVAAWPAEQAETVELVFDGAVDNLQTIGAASERLTEELAQRLQAAARHGRELRLLLESEDGTLHQAQVTLRRPTADSAHLTTAVAELLAAEPLPASVLRLQLTIAELTPAQARQLTLFNRTAESPQLHQTLRNLLAKHRQSHFFRPQSVDPEHPLLERRFQLQRLTYDTFVA